MKKLLIVLCSLFMVIAMAGCTEKKENKEDKYVDATHISLSDKEILVDGNAATNDENQAVYIANDIIYYQDLDVYESGNPYGEGTASDKHSAKEASEHTVVHISEAGSYYITGKLSKGQIAVDLGDDAKTNPEAVVTLIFDDVDITCTIAPAVIFYKVYECDESWVSYDAGEVESYEASAIVDTASAGANVIICDDSTNNIHGSYVAKIYKDAEGKKKKYKFDGAFYSKMSMNINGEEKGNGVLNIIAENEGLDSEVHLTINGGKVTIEAQNDGINTNEDGVSVTTINGGQLHIVAGLGEEGDGVDSNGYLVINGGVVISAANPRSDSGLDSDKGSYINGGTVIALGSTMDWAGKESEQITMNVQFAEMKSSGDAIVLTDEEGTVVFAYDPDKDETLGSNVRTYQGAVISCAGLEIGKGYYLYVGGDITGKEVDGIYDVTSVTAFTGEMQAHGEGSFGGHGGMGGNRPEQFNNGELPEGFEPGNRPDGHPENFDLNNRPEGFEPNGNQELVGGATPPDDENGKEHGGQRPDGFDKGDKMDNGGKQFDNRFEPEGQVGTITVFVMNDKVNNFASVTTYKEPAKEGL